MNTDSVEEIILPEEGAIEALLPRLMGRVFHVSKDHYFNSIKRSAAILPNINGERDTSFGSSSNSYFRNRGCVSVFDYKNPSKKEFDEFMGRCSPLLPALPDTAVFFYFLGNPAVDRLESWSNWKTGEHLREMVVPYIEAGHPGPIPLSDIEEIIKVSLIEDPNSVSASMRRASAERNSRDRRQ